MSASDRVGQFLGRHPILKVPLYPALYIRRKARDRKEREYDEIYQSILRAIGTPSLVVNLPAVEGRFEIDVRSHILRRIVRSGVYEPELVGLIQKHAPRDRDAIDVGANVGIISVLLAHVVSPNRVLSVEPTPSAAAYLRRNIALNGCEASILIEEKAATSRPGTFDINVIPGMEEYSTLGKLVLPDTDKRTPVPTAISGEPIDALVHKHGLNPGFIKIDTEGCEAEVLEGASRTLREFRPVILSELVDSMLTTLGTDSGRVLRFLHEHGYSVLNAYHPGREIRYPFLGEILALPTGARP